MEIWTKVGMISGIILFAYASYNLLNIHSRLETNDVELKEASYDLALACVRYDDPACRQPMHDLLLKCSDNVFDYDTCKLALEYSRAH